MKLGPSKPRFSYRLWHWTTAAENLFDLTPDELRLFELLVSEALK